jgi:hypothetical protein
MSEGATTVATRQFYVEGLKKAALCIGAAVAVGAALPYSFAFAFQAMTYLGFVVALAEGLLSALAEMLEDPDWAYKKIMEAVETLCASLALIAVQATYSAVS